MATTIYILKLQDSKYYVGKTNDVQKRFEQHVKGSGASWTKTHRPVSIVKTIPSSSPFDEDKYVKECMAKYGVENVRGGSYSAMELSDEEYSLLTKEIWSAKDCCLTCGRKGHFANKCYARTTVDGWEIYDSEDSGSEDEDEDDYDSEEDDY